MAYTGRVLPALSEARLAKRKRFEKLSYGVNGALFIFSAWTGAESSPLWITAVCVACGLIQLGSMVRAPEGGLPQRLPYTLAGVGMLASAWGVRSHHTGLPFAYLFAAGLNFALAAVGPDRVAAALRRRA